MTEKLYVKIAMRIQAVKNCEKMVDMDKEVTEEHRDNLRTLISFLPSGSGIDSGNSINMEKSNRNKITINSFYHVMDDNGFYDGWIDFQVIITPDLQHGIDLQIKGKFSNRKGYIRKDCQDIKEMLADLYYEALTTIIK